MIQVKMIVVICDSLSAKLGPFRRAIPPVTLYRFATAPATTCKRSATTSSCPEPACQGGSFTHGRWHRRMCASWITKWNIYDIWMIYDHNMIVKWFFCRNSDKAVFSRLCKPSELATCGMRGRKSPTQFAPKVVLWQMPTASWGVRWRVSPGVV